MHTADLQDLKLSFIEGGTCPSQTSQAQMVTQGFIAFELHILPTDQLHHAKKAPSSSPPHSLIIRWTLMTGSGTPGVVLIAFKYLR